MHLLPFSSVQWETHAVPTVHFIKVVKMAGGKVSITRSVMPEAVALAAKLAPDAGAATASLQFEVNEKGSAVNIKVQKSSDDGWAHDAVEAVREWKFTPARKDGVPVSVASAMDFVRTR